MYNMDRLYEAAGQRGPLCIGLDTAPDYLPPAERRRFPSDAEAVLAFNREIVCAAADVAACFKVQIAYYEAMGRAGLDCYAKTLSFIRRRGSLVIADIKRGDIADTAAQYARAHFEGDFEADFVTLSPYMGMDSVEPWLSWADSRGKGAFVLMRTSNGGMRDFEYLELKEGSAPAERRRLYHAVGDRLAGLALRRRGKSGYGAFGAVVGCTEREEAAEIRKTYGSLFFLIPGYGAQGGAAEDAALLLRDGNGGVVNASRSILKAWTAAPGPPKEMKLNRAAGAARETVLAMGEAIRRAVSRAAAEDYPA
ncbi:MAG: orotidine-5'-phosphate decarboxylase [Treponema sp.]|nr:orotidine-5'-phosphate decarboxylase [Treponema sp.]